MSAARTFWGSFLDGLTGSGLFGDLRIPGSPMTIFRMETETGHLSLRTRVLQEYLSALEDASQRVAGIFEEKEEEHVDVASMLADARMADAEHSAPESHKESQILAQYLQIHGLPTNMEELVRLRGLLSALTEGGGTTARTTVA